MKKYNKQLKAVANLLERKAIEGVLIACPNENNDSAFGINGKPDDLIANLAFLMYHNPHFLEINKAALQIATKRLNNDFSKDVDRTKLN
jgi:hypothetical protein